MKRLLYLVLFLLPFPLISQPYFVQPQMSFIQNASETITDLTFTSSSVSALQAAIDACRVSNPNNIIRITLKGVFTVTTAPIKLSDKMLLILNNATINATTTATATSLLSVSNGQYITISSQGTSVLYGNGLNIIGVSVATSGKIHLDNLTIQKCKNGGIVYTGKGAAVYADAGSVTRCTIQDCTAFGINFTDAYNFICSDNTIQTSNVGLSINANYAAVSNNSIQSCGVGIAANGTYDVITFNTVNKCTTAFSLNNAASEALVSHNTITNNTTAFLLSCGLARIYYNTLTGNTAAASGSGANTTSFVCNKGLTLTDVATKSCIYFNPPLIGNQHTELIKKSKTRVDITLTGGNLTAVRTALNNAHTANPTAVVVAHLNGNFNTNSSTDSLLVKEDECILLNGTIANSAGQTRSVVYFKDSNIYSSFSGGVINGKKINGSNALIYVTGSSNVVLDSIKVMNAATEGISKRSSYNPTYLRACTIDSCVSARAIWVLAAARLFAFSNSASNCRYDGLDLDAFSKNCVAIGNTFNANVRDGIFIEEGSNGNILVNNICNYNQSAGIGFYNMNVANLHTSMNLIAHNSCSQNYRGININALSLDRSTNDNVFFNNILNNNTDVGLGGLYNASVTQNNYLALNSLQGNLKGNFAATRDFSFNTDWNVLLPTVISTETKIVMEQNFSIDSLHFIDHHTLEMTIQGNEIPVWITIRNVAGKQIAVVKGDTGVNKINIAPATSGLYIVQVSNGVSTISRKVMKP